MITGFGIYLIVLGVIAVCANFWYAGRGGSTSTPGVLVFAAILGILNILGIIFLGTGTGI